MPTDKRQFTLRLQDESFLKIQALAALEHRSIAMEIEHIILRYISEWEREKGRIETPDDG